ncbi:MAG: hypothetical protein ACF788_11810 [Novipirellula sp. JB048]
MNPFDAKRIVAQWWLGALLGTFLIALSSPLFVRSYLPSRVDPLRGVVVPDAGYGYRWRSEGYATTAIGPHGMPGRVDLPDAKAADGLRIALWGDSQAEGVCVADEHKLHRQIERIAGEAHHKVVVLPLARSGDDAAEWLAQIPRVETTLAIDLHLILVAEMSDLELASSTASLPVVDPQWQAKHNRLTAHLPAFILHAARRVLRFPDGTSRTLRFSVGPPAADHATIHDTSAASAAERPRTDWDSVMHTLRSSTAQPLWVVYAPRVHRTRVAPVTVAETEPPPAILAEIERAARSAEISLLDMRQAFFRSAAANDWPHGFHNGIFMQGHLNQTGYQVIASEVAKALESSATLAL